jgi:hypothetical protein
MNVTPQLNAQFRSQTRSSSPLLLALDEQRDRPALAVRRSIACLTSPPSSHRSAWLVRMIVSEVSASFGALAVRSFWTDLAKTESMVRQGGIGDLRRNDLRMLREIVKPVG